MAKNLKKSITRRVSIKKPKKTKSETYLVNKKYLGEEPSSATHKGVVDGALLGRCYGWYHIMADNTDAKEYLIQFLKDNNRHIEAKKVKSIADNRLPLTACWIARMTSNGLQLPEKSLKFFEKSLEESLNKTVEKTEEAPVEEKTNVIQDRIDDKMNDFIGKLETYVDAGEPFDVYAMLQTDNISSRFVGRIIDYYQPFLDEAKLLVAGTDKDLNEGFSSLSKKQKQLRVALFEHIITECERFVGNVKKSTVKKTRVKKPLSLDKKVKDFKFMKENNDYQLVSHAAHDIVGASEVWLFNTSGKTLTVLRARDRGGLDVSKPSSIINHDETTSVTKKTGRQTKNLLTQVQNSGKVILRKLMDNIKSDTIETQTKSTKNTVIVKVVK